MPRKFFSESFAQDSMDKDRFSSAGLLSSQTAFFLSEALLLCTVFQDRALDSHLNYNGALLPYWYIITYRTLSPPPYWFSPTRSRLSSAKVPIQHFYGDIGKLIETKEKPYTPPLPKMGQTTEKGIIISARYIFHIWKKPPLPEETSWEVSSTQFNKGV